MAEVSFYHNLDPYRTQWNTFICAFQFFLDKHVWLAVEDIGDLLLKSKSYTLKHDELEKFLVAQTYYPALQRIKAKIHVDRYPLTKERLLLYLP